MIKLPKVAIIVTLLLLLGLISFIIILIELVFTQNTINIEFSVLEYRISVFIISIIAFILGVFFISLHQSWTLENFANRIENGITANHMLFLIQQKKAQMGWEDDVDIIIKKGKDK